MDQLIRILQEFEFRGAMDTESDTSDALTVYCHGPDASNDVLRKLNVSPDLEFSHLDQHQNTFAEASPIASTGLALKSLQSVAVDLNLLPDQFRKKPSIISRYLSIVLVLLTLITAMAWAGSYYIHYRIMDRQVDQELNELSGEIKTLGQAQSQIATLQERIDYLNILRQNRIYALEFLKELTEVIPDTAWLRRLSVKDNQVIVEGYADYSTQLIQQLETSPLFSDAKFISSITMGRDGKEVFKIGFEINRQSGESEK